MDQNAQKIAESDRLKYRRIHLAVTAIERGAKILGIDGREMHDRLQAQGLVGSYLLAGYEPLHTQSYEYVADSTVETLRNWESARRKRGGPRCAMMSLSGKSLE